jgi:uncharacterized membrane protein
MICLAIGLGVLGALAFRRARRCRGGGMGWHGPWSHHYGHDPDGHHDRGGWPGRRGRRWMMHAALARIDATPAQERFIVNEIDKVKQRVGAARSNLKDARGNLASAVRGPTLDDAALAATLGRVDGATAEARAAIVDGLRNIHGILDEKQRAQVADMLDSGGGWWRSGPYR